jgi:hypothetical protein
MKRIQLPNTMTIILAIFILAVSCKTSKTEDVSKTFQFEMNFSYPGDPVFVFDHLTGDISRWWDHSFSPNPYKLFIEPWPGGGFYEIFDESGNGALHATVIFAKRGEMLRMEGPLGLSGQALTLVSTYTLKPSEPEGTQLTLNVNGAGEFTPETPEMVRQVWEHFLWERFKPYIEAHHGQR